MDIGFPPDWTHELLTPAAIILSVTIWVVYMLWLNRLLVEKKVTLEPKKPEDR